nr:tripartite motif-containing protein 35-like [Paramormyrops kingsleyae]
MAYRYHLPEQDLVCPICFDIYTDPVVLSCSHSFCRVCTEQFWDGNGCQQCPVCMQRFINCELLCNRALKNLCEAFKSQRSQITEDSQGLCLLHGEQLKVFCLVEKEAICVDCLTQTHKGHKICSTGEAVRHYKGELRNVLKNIQERKQLFHKVKSTFQNTVKHIEVQTRHTEQQIQREFQDLHQLLLDQEAVRILELREEAEKKRTAMNEKIQELTEEISSLSDTICTIKPLFTSDSISVLQEHFTIAKKSSHEIQNLEVGPRALINVAQYLNSLKYKVWMTMMQTVQHVPVTLDPNTAAPQLILSEDLTGLRATGENQQLPNNPERIIGYEGVLGSEGFSFGKHSWVVDVGSNTEWALGVARESIKRKEVIAASPEEGFWAIGWSSGKCLTATSPPTCLTKQRLERIRIKLNLEKRTLKFYDHTKNTPLHTFTPKFTGKLFPYFFTNQGHPLIIQPENVSVTSQ